MRRQRFKWLFLISLLLAVQTSLASEAGLDPTRLKQSKVRCVHHNTVNVFPAPVFPTKRSGLASGPQEITAIREKIIYPLIVESVDPVAAIIVEFFSKKPNEIGVGVY